MKMVYVFTWPKCRGCISLKQMLTEQSIPFVGIDTTAPGNRQLWNDIKFQTKSEAVPMVFIRDKKTLEGTAYIPNQDFISTEEIVEIIKKNI